jgi:hypothetical protein
LFSMPSLLSMWFLASLLMSFMSALWTCQDSLFSILETNKKKLICVGCDRNL